ncbi:MAG TPA: cob(I)yrinic acid a,c-diamide adenosyltransferase [Opitutaceae bacterium]|nr:cob(I)yrinic acid a,c-diamide adenosyltransferase [Opitutaceae bacterium]
MSRSISTRTGDDGTTGLLYGQRVPKDHPQIEAVGSLDEFNAVLGLAKATCPDVGRQALLERIQRDLVTLMGEIACADNDNGRYAVSKFTKLGDGDLARIDAGVAAIEARNPKSDGWATPGANPYAAVLDLARTSARRAERRLAGLPHQGKTVRPLLLQYLNRVSDLLWLMAREAETGT